LRSIAEQDIKGKKLYVARAQKKTERMDELQRKYETIKQERLNKYQGVNLYVKNLDDSIDSERLRQEFSIFGTITSHKIVSDDKGNSKGFGFVCFSSPEEATQAVAEFNGRMLGNKPLYVALAQRKEVRRQQLAAQHHQRMLANQSGMMAPGMFGSPQVFYSNPVTMQPPRGGQGYLPFVRPPRWAPPQQGRPNFNAGGPSGVYGGNPGIRPNRQNRQQRTTVPPSTNPAAIPINGAQTNGPARPPMAQQSPQLAAQQQQQQQQRSRTNLKYTSNARNARTDGGAINSASPNADALTADRLAGMSIEDQKRNLGDRIFLQVQEKQPQLAPKITGMLLELDNSELLNLLENPSQLDLHVHEAISVLEKHESSA